MAYPRNELNILLWGRDSPFPLTPPILLFFHQELDQLDGLILETGALAQCCRDGWVPVLFMWCSQETAKRKRNWKLSRTGVGSAVPVRAIQWCPFYTEGAELGEVAKSVS